MRVWPQYKDKGGIYTESLLDKPTSLPFFLSDPSLYEEISMEDLDDGAFSL